MSQSTIIGSFNLSALFTKGGGEPSFSGGCQERGADFFTDKDINKNFFSVITKNSNWEILTENFVTFRRWG